MVKFSYSESNLLCYMKSLVEEVPLAININGVNFAVMLASPFDLDDFVVGYLHSESIIESNIDIHDIEIERQDDALLLNVTIANRCSDKLKQRQRQLKGTSGCGLCGTESLSMAFPDLPKLAGATPFDIHLVSQIKPSLRQHQTQGADSGALHAAFWLSAQGEILACREDIGRHNALDKIIGYLLRKNIPAESGAALVTSRCGVELVQKAILMRIPTLLSLASPSNLAVKMAQSSNLQLIHIPKHDAPYFLSGASQ